MKLILLYTSIIPLTALKNYTLQWNNLRLHGLGVKFIAVRTDKQICKYNGGK